MAAVQEITAKAKTYVVKVRGGGPGLHTNLSVELDNKKIPYEKTRVGTSDWARFVWYHFKTAQHAETAKKIVRALKQMASRHVK